MVCTFIIPQTEVRFKTPSNRRSLIVPIATRSLDTYALLLCGADLCDVTISTIEPLVPLTNPREATIRTRSVAIPTRNRPAAYGPPGGFALHHIVDTRSMNLYPAKGRRGRYS